MCGNQNRMEVIWGNQILDEGFTSIPNLIILNHKKVGVTPAEWEFITVLMTFKHNIKDPFPSRKTLAEHLQCSEKQIQKLIRSLRKKELIRVGKRINHKTQMQSTNVYSLEPLVQSILKMEGINHHPTAIDYDVVWEDEEDIKSNNLAGSPEVTPKIKRENENDKMKRLSINQGKLSERIHTWLNKNIDRLTDNQIESIIEVYNEMSVILPNDKDVIFISVLANTLDYKPKSFKRYLKRSLSKEVSINPNTITLSEKFSDPIENFIDKAFQEQNVPGNRTKKTSESSSSYYQTN